MFDQSLLGPVPESLQAVDVDLTGGKVLLVVHRQMLVSSEHEAVIAVELVGVPTKSRWTFLKVSSRTWRPRHPERSHEPGHRVPEHLRQVLCRPPLGPDWSTIRKSPGRCNHNGNNDNVPLVFYGALGRDSESKNTDGFWSIFHTGIFGPCFHSNLSCSKNSAQCGTLNIGSRIGFITKFKILIIESRHLVGTAVNALTWPAICRTCTHYLASFVGFEISR